MVLAAILLFAMLAAARAEEPRLAVPEQLMEWKLENRVEPHYPDRARRFRITGQVRFAAVIAKDGSVRSLHLISGHPLLVPAALKAAKQWVYRPTLHKGEPIEVVTRITIEFRLPPPPSPDPLVRCFQRSAAGGPVPA